MAERILRVGLTGGLATGKSTVLQALSEGGAATIDADELAREALAPGSPLVDRVVAEFGDGILAADGAVDRQALADLVFTDADKRKKLEAIIHPEVIRRTEEAIAKFADEGARMAVVDSPLLYEADRAGDFDRVVVVACEPGTQLRRAIERGLSEDDARARIAAQLPLAAKINRADYVIETDGTVEQTAQRSRTTHALLQRDAEILQRDGELRRA